MNGAVAAMVESLLALARQRLPKAVIGAWGTHLYGVVVTTDVSLKEWGAELAASHQSQVDGTPRTLRIVPRLEVVERKRGESPSAFFDRLAAASETPTNS